MRSATSAGWAVETDGWHQVLVQLLRPLHVIERPESAPWCPRAPEHVHKNVNATLVFEHRLGDLVGSLRRRKGPRRDSAHRQ